MAYTVMFNTTAIHGLPAALNAASNALLHSLPGGTEGGASIDVRNHPMPTLPGEPAVRFSKVAGEAASPDPPCRRCRDRQRYQAGTMCAVSKLCVCWHLHTCTELMGFHRSRRSFGPKASGIAVCYVVGDPAMLRLSAGAIVYLLSLCVLDM